MRTTLYKKAGRATFHLYREHEKKRLQCEFFITAEVTWTAESHCIALVKVVVNWCTTTSIGRNPTWSSRFVNSHDCQEHNSNATFHQIQECEVNKLYTRLRTKLGNVMAYKKVKKETGSRLRWAVHSIKLLDDKPAAFYVRKIFHAQK